MFNLPLVNEILMGFDIGKLGGMCSGDGRYIALEETPETPKELSKAIRFSNPSTIIAENVHTMPGQGVASSGNLMQSKGVLMGVAAALNIKLVFIEPLKWIETFTLKRTKHFESKNDWKKYLMSIAQALAPQEHFTLKTTDAFLIWYYYARVLRGEAKPLGFKL